MRPDPRSVIRTVQRRLRLGRDLVGLLSIGDDVHDLPPSLRWSSTNGHPVLLAEPMPALRRGQFALQPLRDRLPYHPRSPEFVVCADADGDVELTVLFLDRNGGTTGTARGGSEVRASIPAGTSHVRVRLTTHRTRVHRIVFGHRADGPKHVDGTAPTLVLSNDYPRNDDLYANAFIHARVRRYLDEGRRVDVLRYQRGLPFETDTFDGVGVMSGSDETLGRLLEHGAYRTVLVHFLNRGMWDNLRSRMDTHRVVVWIHGYEIQPWQRRAFLVTNDEQRASAESASAERMRLWDEVLRTAHPHLHLVFVSRTLLAQVEEDYGLTLPIEQYSIIHNPIDDERFAYGPKPVDQRFNVLSIRPYASAVYANDLAVDAIRLLSAEPEFDRMRFRLIGDGPLFDATVAPLRGFGNVTLERRFMTQAEIAATHRDYGVFLCPTRMDSQGVSRDEAMSSGLVPVTTRIAAVPEFVDDASGLLCAPESAAGLAAAMLRLVREPDLFGRLSAGAAARVREQRGAYQMLQAELALFEA